MTVPRFYSRDRRSRTLKLSAALVLSLAAHLLLVFGVPATLATGAVKRGASTLVARLVMSNALPVPVPPTEEELSSGPVLQPSPTDAPRTEKTTAPQMEKPHPAPRSPDPAPIALPLPFDPVFYTWREVDVTARLQGDGNPPFPAEARAAGVAGQVTIEVWVDETGQVDHASVIQAEPPGYFEAATLAHYRSQHFSPAMKDGKPRRFRARFVLDFGDSPSAEESLRK